MQVLKFGGSSISNAKTTTLGRGGSDYTASLFDVAADAEFVYELSLGKVNPLIVEKGFSIISLSWR